ncbi:MAG: hypothetical protein WC783_00020 [Candidatus Paceibacterota bacterium]|jgi:hypothetical protein
MEKFIKILSKRKGIVPIVDLGIYLKDSHILPASRALKSESLKELVAKGDVLIYDKETYKQLSIEDFKLPIIKDKDVVITTPQVKPETAVVSNDNQIIEMLKTMQGDINTLKNKPSEKVYIESENRLQYDKREFSDIKDEIFIGSNNDKFESNINEVVLPVKQEDSGNINDVLKALKKIRNDNNS